MLVHKHEQQTVKVKYKSKEERYKHKITPKRVIEKETEELDEKPLCHTSSDKSIH